LVWNWQKLQPFAQRERQAQRVSQYGAARQYLYLLFFEIKSRIIEKYDPCPLHEWGAQAVRISKPVKVLNYCFDRQEGNARTNDQAGMSINRLG
jgi:hypothetical protein